MYNFYNDYFYKIYVVDFYSWKCDGERFLTESFLNKYSEEGAIPQLNDGKPEFGTWISYTNASGGFCVGGWNWGTRYDLARPFIENMLNIFREKNIPDQCLTWLKYSLMCLDEANDIKKKLFDHKKLTLNVIL